MSGFKRVNGRRVEARLITKSGQRRVTIFKPILVEDAMAERFKGLAREYGMTQTEFLRYLIGDGNNGNNGNNGNGQANGFNGAAQYASGEAPAGLPEGTGNLFVTSSHL